MKNVIKYTKQYTFTLNGILSSYIRTTYDLNTTGKFNLTYYNKNLNTLCTKLHCVQNYTVYKITLCTKLHCVQK